MDKKLKFLVFLFLFISFTSAYVSAAPLKYKVDYKGLKKLKASGHTAVNKDYLKNENLSLVLKYINRRYFHGKYPEVRLNNGEMLFPYGITIPTVFLRIRRLTLIKLPAGTKILNVAVGNSDNFKFLKITNSSGDYLALKSTHPALRTTMIINAVDRIYYFNLVSTRNRYMPMVGFYFPGIYIKSYSSVTNFSKQNIATPSGFSINDLNFQYYVVGNGYNVSRVFNDGKETFIKLSKLNGTPLPAIFVEHGGKKYLVNFIYRGGYYVVRGVPKTIVLISRTKNTKKEIKINLGKKPATGWTW